MSLRVAYVAPSLGEAEGQGRVNLECIRRLVAAGVRVDVFTSRLPSSGLAGVRIRRAPRPFRAQLPNQLLFVVWATLAVRRRRYDLIHADGASLLRRADVVAAHMLHSVWRAVGKQLRLRRERGIRGWYHRASSALNAALERRAYRRARLVLANSRRTATDLIQVLGIAPSKIRVLPLGVDARRFRVPTAQQRSGARAAFGIRPEEFVAVLVGAADARKGVPQAVEAFAGLDGARLVVVGDTRGTGIAGHAQRIGATVTFAEWPADPLPYYWAADVLLHPATYEPFGLAVLEAMACGLPVAVTAASGVAALCNGSAVTITADADSIRDAVQRIRTDPEARSSMARHARAVAQEQTWDATAAALRAAYAEVKR